MDSKTYRKKLAQIMPGYNWTVHKAPKNANYLVATGIQSSGFNRLSTLEIRWSNRTGHDIFTARSAGFGKRAPWLYEISDGTLAKTLRGLQDHYQHKAGIYSGHAAALAKGRKTAV